MKYIVITLLSLFATSVQAGIIYTVSDGTTTTIVSPLTKAESASDYYKYGFEAASGNPDFGPEEDKAFFWLYEDTNTNILSLGMIFDKRCSVPASCTTGGTMKVTSSGMPGSASVSVSDDASETGTLINGAENWGWNNANSDGAMISGLEASTWTIDLLLRDFSGLGSGFAFVDGPSSNGSSDIALALNIGDTLTITARIPEPSIIALFAAGLFGIGFARRRQS